MTQLVLSPFVTATLIQIARNETALHHQYRLAHEKNITADETTRRMYGEQAIAHGQLAQFFLHLVEQRLLAQQRIIGKPPPEETKAPE